ncbi:retrovirus-related pol polyprotein from transposon TNT 1-94, partial [Tanacetum coccineum]
RTRRIIETIHVDFDELTAMASEHSSSGPALHEMTPVTNSSGLVPNPPPSTPFVPPSRSDWDLLFQPMFDESLNPPPYVDLQAPEVIAPIPEVVAPEHAVSTGSPSSTTVDQDAPSSSNSHTTQETQTPIISHDAEEDNHDIEVAHMGNDPYFGIPVPEVASGQYLSSDVIHTIVPPDHQVSEHNSKWTKDHPLENIIGALDEQFPSTTTPHELSLICYMIAFLTSVDLRYFTRRINSNIQIYVTAYESSFYGLKQAPRAWYDMLSSFLISNDFSKGSVDPTLFIRREGKELLLVQIYVDDIIFAASTPELCISQSPRGIFINQSKYALESLKKYGFESCDPVDTPMVEKSKLDEDKEGNAVDPSHYRGMIGTLLYLTASRLAGPTYLLYVCVPNSAADIQYGAEYIALSGCCAQVLWMRSQLTDYGYGFNKIPMYCDNKSAIALCCNNVQHSRSKHIDIRFHFIKEHVENGVIELYFVNTEYQLADIFTKALGRERIEFLINKLGMRSFTPET